VFATGGILAALTIVTSIIVPLVDTSSAAAPVPAASATASVSELKSFAAAPPTTPTAQATAGAPKTLLDPNAVGDPYTPTVTLCPVGTVAGSVDDVGNQSNCAPPIAATPAP